MKRLLRDGRMTESRSVDQQGWKRDWREFKKGRPGQRFLECYEHNRQLRSQRSAFRRTIKPLAGGLLILGGLVLCLIPGSGLPLLVFGAALPADASRQTAQALDRIETWLRSLLPRSSPAPLTLAQNPSQPLYNDERCPATPADRSAPAPGRGAS
jgi:hypothetical protein